MLSFITPHLRIENALDLGASDFAALGIRGLLLDVDGTLKEFHSPSVSREVVDWIAALRSAGIRLCILSNGMGLRIGKIAEALDVPFIAKAFKPLPFGCRRALAVLRLPRHEVAIIGDQVFADVLAGRLAGLKTIYVPPLSLDEPWFTRIKRPAERQLLRWMKPTLSLPVPSTPELSMCSDALASNAAS